MIVFKNRTPTLEEYKRLRRAVDWNLDEGGISDKRARKSLKNSPLCVCAYHGGDIVGMVRLAGDLEMYGYIQDTIVLPEYQGRSIGKGLLKRIFDAIESKPGYLLGVCPSKSSVDFYRKFGFEKRLQDPNGFMSLKVK